MNNTGNTPIEDLRKSALEHYDEAAKSVHSFHSVIPQAINYYFDSRIAEEEKKSKFWKWANFMGRLYLFVLLFAFVVAKVSQWYGLL